MKLLYSHALCLIALSPSVLAVSEHDLDWASRSRFAHVDTDNTGKAASLLLRATLTSEWNSVIRSEFEIDHVATAFKDDHSDGVRLNNQPIIPDVPGTEINQAWLAFNVDEVFVKLGRQLMNVDNQRFVGGNGFWQNEQTFDAVSSAVKISSHSRISYTYIANANRIFGDDADKNNLGHEPVDGAPDSRSPNLWGDHKHNSHFARLEWSEWDYTRLVAYGYRIDNRDLPSVSNNTLGVTYNFNYKHDAIKYRVQIDAARQNKVALNVNSLAYYAVDVGVGMGAYEVSSRYEILGAKQETGFVTPLGSLHDFDGWANQISNTPDTGVRDFSLSAVWRASPLRIETTYHIFSQAEGRGEIGRELDAAFLIKPAQKHSFALRFAHFQPDADNASSVQKVFFDYTYNL